MLTNSQSKIICNEDKRNTAYNTILSQVSNLIEENGIKDVSLSESSNLTTVTFRIEDRSNNITSLKVQRNKNDETLPICIIDSEGKKHVRIFDNNTWKVWNSLIDDVTSRTASDKLYNDQGFLNSILPTLNKVLSFYRKNKCIDLSNASKSTTSTPASETTDEEAKEIWETAQVLQKTDFNNAMEKVNDTMKEIREQNRRDNISLPANVTNTIRTSSFNLLGVNNGGIENAMLPTPGITWGAVIPITALTTLGVIGGVTGGVLGMLALGLGAKAAYEWYTSDQYVAVVQQRKPSTAVTSTIIQMEERIALNQ